MRGVGVLKVEGIWARVRSLVEGVLGESSGEGVSGDLSVFVSFFVSFCDRFFWLLIFGVI